MRGTRLAMTGLIAIAVSLGPIPLSAGVLPGPVGDQEQEAKPNKAERLEAIAAELLSECDMETWVRAAELFETSARLRPEASKERIKNFKTAANLFASTGAKERARDLFQEAADEAWEMGDLAFAAHSYLDAAVLSAELKMGRHTINAARMANQIAGSPELPTADRAAIEQRIEQLGLPLHLGQIL